MAADPAHALLGDVGGFGFGANEGGVAGAVAFAEGVPAGDEGDGFLVVHRHAAEGLADIAARGDGVGIAVRPFRVDVDEAHLHRAERVLKLAVAGVAVVAEPGGFGAPVNVRLGFPDVGPAAGEAEGLKAHRLQRAVARQNHQVGPGNPLAVFALDRPQQHPRLVEVAVVRPTVDRGEALVAGAAAAAAVGDAVGSGAVPGHADEQRAVVAVVRGPPVLGGGEHLANVPLEGVEIKALEGFGVVERRAHGVGFFRMLVQDFEVELVRPPVRVGRAETRGELLRAARERAFDGVVHDCSFL